jgi:hypothetical protein
MFNFYRRFVPAAARILRPLTDSTRGSPKATAAVDWTPPMVAAFDAARPTLGAAALLTHPQQDQELVVMVNASADHVGAALQQRRSAVADWQPLAFFSKKLEPAQMRYSAFDRELFACVTGIRHFRYMLEGRPFTIYTNHKPLTFALGKVSEPWMAMQSRQLSSWPSSQQISVIYRVLKTSWQTRCPDRPRPPFRRLPQPTRRSRQ